MLYFRDFDMVVLRIADVVSMTWLPEGERQHPKMLYRLEMANGQSRFIDNHNFSLLMGENSSYISAVSNTVLLNLFDVDDDGSEFLVARRLPIIGWRISADGEVQPVTPEGVWPVEEPWYVVTPNGAVFGKEKDMFESESALLVNLQNRKVIPDV